MISLLAEGAETFPLDATLPVKMSKKRNCSLRSSDNARIIISISFVHSNMSDTKLNVTSNGFPPQQVPL